MRTVILVVAMILGLSSLAVAQQPRSVPPTSIVDEAKELRESVELVGLPKEFVVDGETPHNSYFLGAETIVFKPGARLVFSDTALKTRNYLLIAARTIVVEDQNRPGVITWARGDGPAASPPQSGQAPGGAHGRSDGESGGPGAPGAQGNPGVDGRNAPSLTVFLTGLKGGPPTIDLRGQPGGAGGKGQQGGAGGVGHRGRPASSSAFDCKRGAGHGGNGGAGGPGGRGGIGATGGAGGTVTLVSLPPAFPALLQLVRVDVSGGEGGEGGAGGDPGNPGPGGPQGAKSLPHCKDEPGRAGKAGAAGQGGGKGDKGAVGIQGEILYTTLTEEAFKRLFGGGR